MKSKKKPKRKHKPIKQVIKDGEKIFKGKKKLSPKEAIKNMEKILQKS